MPLDLLVPDLLSADAPPAARPDRLASVEKWLARADAARHPARGAAAWLADAYALPALPVAALGRLGDTGSAEGAWMRADPVHLAIEGDALRLRDASSLGIGLEEARSLAAALQSHFAPDGLEFHAQTPVRWYVKLAAGEAPATTPLAEALGRNVFGLLPHDGKWRSAMTEAQMILNGHEVNARREAEGKPAINSVWFWGAGALPAAVARPYAVVHANDASARGLATLSGAKLQDVPAGVSGIDLAREDDAVLAIVDGIDAATLDERWFRPLGEAIERFDRVRLILPSSGDTLVATLTASARWRWFRAARPLSAYA
jgi:hypothetical protein